MSNQLFVFLPFVSLLLCRLEYYPTSSCDTFEVFFTRMQLSFAVFFLSFLRFDHLIDLFPLKRFVIVLLLFLFAYPVGIRIYLQLLISPINNDLLNNTRVANMQTQLYIQ